MPGVLLHFSIHHWRSFRPKRLFVGIRLQTWEIPEVMITEDFNESKQTEIQNSVQKSQWYQADHACHNNNWASVASSTGVPQSE